MALIAAILVVVFVVGSFADWPTSSSPPGDPSAAGVIDFGPSWSPDSRWIAFDRSDYGPPGNTPEGASDVFVASADGRVVRRLTRTPAPYNETVWGWLEKPLRIVYASRAVSMHERRDVPTELYTVDLKGATPVALGEVRAADQLLALSHDGGRALVGTPWSATKHYALVDLVRRTRRPLPGIPDAWAMTYWPEGAWSPDDSMLAYVTAEHIVIVRGDRVVRRVPRERYDLGSSGLAWSPDGRRLAYGSSFCNGNSSLWLVRIEDGSRSRLTEGGGDTSACNPVWSPDGRKIYYEHNSFDDRDGLRMMSPDGTGDTKITTDDWDGDGPQDLWLDNATLSPDGTKIAYLLGELGAWKNWTLVGVMNADGSGKTPFPGSR